MWSRTPSESQPCPDVPGPHPPGLECRAADGAASELGNAFSFLSSLYLLLNSRTAVAYTLTNKKYSASALSPEAVQKEAGLILALIEDLEKSYPAIARSVLEKEKTDLLHLQLADVNKPYEPGKNEGTGLLARWAQEATKAGSADSFTKWLGFWREKIDGSNFQRFKEVSGAVMGYDYGGVTTKWFVLLGGDFVMMNPTLARRAVRENADLQEKVKQRVQALARENETSHRYNAEELKWALLREATLVAGEPARKALYWIFLLTRGERGQVSLQVDPRKDKRESIEADISYLVHQLSKESQTR